jgi:ATP-dependent exoDNAse (exonuclease V) alpha subunit
MPPRKNKPHNPENDNPDYKRLMAIYKYYDTRFTKLKGHSFGLAPTMPQDYWVDNDRSRISFIFLHDWLHKTAGLSITRIGDILSKVLQINNLSECSIPGIIIEPLKYTRGRNKVLLFDQAVRMAEIQGLITPTDELLISWIDHYLSNSRNTLNSHWVKWPTLDKAIKAELQHPRYNRDTTNPISGFNIATFAKTYLKIKKIAPETDEKYATTRELYALEQEVNELMRELFFYLDGTPRPATRLTNHFTCSDLDNALSTKIQEYQAVYSHKYGWNFTFKMAQIAAIKGCCQSQLSIIIGQPGTGKSTIAECITECLYSLEYSAISLTAISGMAVGQIKNKCAMVAARNENLCGTIDKLLYTVYPDLEPIYQPDAIIIDEFSMVDIRKWHQILEYCRKFRCQVILIGDMFQLPSIGAGRLLATICQYPDQYPIYQLTDIMRQTGHLSQIIQRMTTCIIDDTLFNNQDFIFEDFDGGPETEFFIRYMVDKYNLEARNCRFLCSQNNGDCGITRINRILQNIYNSVGQDISPPKSIKTHDLIFRVGDLVIRCANDYLKGAELDPPQIYLNGDCGCLTRLDDKRYSITYHGDGLTRQETVGLDELYENFTVGYAISVHKAQGSQYDNVVIMMTTDQKFMWCHPLCEGFNLLYTAISRAKHRCILAGKYGYFLDAQKGRTRKDTEPKRLSICCHPKYIFKSSE